MKTLGFIAAAVRAATYICVPPQLAHAQTAQWERIIIGPASTPPTRAFQNIANWSLLAEGSFVRAAQGAAYDSIKRKVVVFGGGSRIDIPRPPVTDTGTYEFNGADWTKVAELGPPPRALPGLVFDSFRGVAVLYGGVLTGGSWSYYDDTWEWNGVEWTEIDVATPSHIRVFFSMAYDAKRRKVVLFGGSPTVHTVYSNETWEYGLIPLRVTATSGPVDGTFEIQWTGELPPYQLQSRASLSAGEWQNEGESTDATRSLVQAEGPTQFFRVISLSDGSP